MHFVGMLAWVPPFVLFYSVSRTAVSLAAAVVASIVAMRLAVAPALPSRLRLTVGAVFVAAGICAMHYIGISAVLTTKGWAGTGLGLSISAEILERHGGTLRFDTRTEPPNQGTTFRMLLPKQARGRITHLS